MSKNNRTINDIWLKWARKKRYGVAFGKPSELETVKSFIDEKRKKAQFERKFYNNWIKEFEHTDDLLVRSNKAMVIVAVPKPAFKIPFTYKSKTRTAILPPTYACYRSTFQQICAEARTLFKREPYRIETINAPLKSLAVATGLVKYGRNNITYHHEMGSYFQLVGFMTDMTLDSNPVQNNLDDESNLMPLCKTCQACLKACPTGAIDKDRLLLHAEKCYTLYSETSGKLPESLIPPSPECIIGCMKCQLVCPLNKGKLHYEFAPFCLFEEETTFLVHHFDPASPLTMKVNQKFNLLHLSEGIDLYTRNFKRLVSLSPY